MRRFIANIALFMLPFFLFSLLMLPFYIVAAYTGEIGSFDRYILMQRNNPKILIGMGYNEQTSYYKLVNVNYFRPEVIALGTSRVMQFKREFFRASFYNCGGAVNGNYDEYTNFLQNLNYNPKVILLGLDSWVFNREWNKNRRKYSTFYKINQSNAVLAPLVSIIKGWLREKWKFADINLYPVNIGFNGRVLGNGFMDDGSYYYGNIYRYSEKQIDYKFANTFHRISTGINRFEWGKHIDLYTIEKLDNLLEYCSNNNIHVIGFTAPFAPDVHEMMNTSRNYGYINEIPQTCKSVFSKYNFEFYDYLDAARLNVKNDCFIDGFHGSEVVYGLILEDMISKGSYIEEYTDSEKIAALIKNRHNGLVFYEPSTN